MTAIHRFAVIGHPVQHSRSPIIHHAFAQQFGIDLVYEKIEAPINNFEATVRQFFKTGGSGLNVTVPFKENAWQMAQNHLSERAALAGAVNTLWQVNENLHGCNTDGVGLVNDLERLGVKLNGARIMMVGAGGAARGVMQPLIDAGCAHLHIVNRTETRAHELSALCLSHLAKRSVQRTLASHSSQALQSHLQGSLAHQDQPVITAGSLADAKLGAPWSLVINASSSSLSNQAPALPADLYAQGAWAYDMMYGANPTAFMMQAKQAGASNQADGLGMLVGQAAESFYIWHGVKPDPLPVIELLRNTLQTT